MRLAFGVIVLLLGLLAWAGQTLSWLAPVTARKYGLTESEEDVDPVFWADIRGEAAWDAFTLWVAVVAGFLLIVDNAAWPYFGLVAGGAYLYFGGRGILARLAMIRRGLRIGSEQSVGVGLVFLGIWAVMGLALIVTSVVELA